MKKSDLARIKIEKAIELFYEKNYACSITLAGAAEEMLGNILRINGENNILGELHLWFKEHYSTDISFSELAKGANEIRDELKHGHTFSDLNHEVEISLAYCTQMLQRAYVNYSRAVGMPSEQMALFAKYVVENEKELFSEWT